MNKDNLEVITATILLAILAISALCFLHWATH